MLSQAEIYALAALIQRLTPLMTQYEVQFTQAVLARLENEARLLLKRQKGSASEKDNGLDSDS